MNLREQGKERRRQRILQAVVAILSEEGVAALSTARIAERAAVSVATLYNLIGSLDDILDLLVQSMFADFRQQLLAAGESAQPEQVFDRYIEVTHTFIGADESGRRAALRAIFSLNMSRGKSIPVVAVTHDGRKVLADAIAACQRAGLIKTAVRADQLAEQMVFAQSILLESWAANFISLERFHLSCRSHFWTLIRAWAERRLAARADRILLQLQRDIEALDALRRGGRTSVGVT